MPDFGFIGTSYTAPSIYQNDQECINFFAEIDPTKNQGERGVVALYPTPGLVMQVQLDNAPIRGMFTMTGAQYFIAVSGASVYKVDANYAATKIGTLASSQGYVSISDNQTGDGLIAYIVDGANRYTYNFTTDTFLQLPVSDGPWQGATIVDSVDGYNIYNQPETFNWGCTNLNSGLSTGAFYGSANGYPDNIVSLIVDRRQVYLLKEVTTEVWTNVGNQIPGLTTFPFQRVPGTMMQSGCAAPFSVARFGDSFAFLAQDTRGNSTIEMITGYSFQRISTHAVEQSLLNQRTNDAAAFTYQIEGHEMYVITFPSIGNGLTWVYDLTTQSWHKWLYWNGAEYTRHRANCGCFFNRMYLVGDFENGKIYSLENEIYTDNGSAIRRLRRARHLTNDLQRQYFESFQIQFQPGVGLPTSVVSTNSFTPSTGSKTFVINPTVTAFVIGANVLISYINNTTEFMRGKITAISGNSITVLVSQFNGSISRSNWDISTDNSGPQAMLRWSNDGGSTWSNEHWVGIGKQGNYVNRALWRRLGWSRDRIFEVVVSDPIKAVIVSAELKASVGDN
jgi:hypothetical protein